MKTKNLLLTAVSLLLIATSAVLGQADLEGTFEYKLERSGTVTLTVAVVDYDEEEPVSGIEVEFFALEDEGRVPLGKEMTDESGIAQLVNLEKSSIPVGGGQMRFEAVFPGDENWAELTLSRTIRDLLLTLTFSEDEEEGEREMEILMEVWDEEGQKVPLEEGEAIVYVSRLFSLLPVDGDVWTEEDGTYITVFPNDLPGDENGAFEVVVRIEDSDDFGNIDVAQTVEWGLATNGSADRLPRALWSDTAPLWMVLTFWILMAAVWVHYFMVVLNIVKVKKYRTEIET